MRCRSSLVSLVAVLSVAVAACGYGDNTDYLQGGELDAGLDAALDLAPDAALPPEDCGNRSDDDGDGRSDCGDDDCAAAPHCTPEMACMDGLDDDLDGDIDCDDADCAIAVHCSPEGLCGDRTDNDLDGGVDCDDTDCLAACLTACPDDQLALAVPASGLPLPVGALAVMLDLPVSAPGVITGAAVHLTAAHSFDADLDLTLRSPAGTTLDLSSDNGGGGDGYVATYFADRGETAITAGTAPFSGTYRPEQPLSGLDGQASAGVWRFTASDDYPADSDVGTVQIVELFVCVCDGVEGCEFGLACDDGLDNDGDALVDCADSACAAMPQCIPEPDCDDRLDEDLDGDVDCLDLDCDGRDGCEHGSETTCDDGLDNDGDGHADCSDDECTVSAYCAPEDECHDGSDDDDDGAADCLDPGCDGDGDCELGTELSCSDGADNDGDGGVDCADPDCGAAFYCAILECPAGTSKRIYTATDLPIGLFDHQMVASIIAVSTRGLVAAVAARVDLSHGRDGDLDLVLGTPNGRRELSNNSGGSGQNYVATQFADSGAAVIGSTGNNTAPFSGRFRPVQPLATLAGTPLDGDWSLAVRDEVTGSTGALEGFSVLLCACDASSGDCEFGPIACRNHRDDDGDHIRDCDEPSCATDVHCIPEADCDDGLDDDLDGPVDCADRDCDGVAGCTWGHEADCGDGFDNDSDGLIDCLDPECSQRDVCLTESDCDNGRDEDNDGLFDCADPECATDPWCVPETSCNNGVDDDGDGLIDCAEHGCDGLDGCTHAGEAACDDGLDNDGDGAPDCADIECASATVCAIATCPIGSSKRLYASAEVPLPIPDPGTATSTISVPIAGLVTAVAVRFDITHPYDDDLDLFLDAPGGTRQLSTDNGGSGDDYVNTRLVDSAAAVIGTPSNNNAPFTGLYRPEQPLSALVGTQLAGPWRLRASDDAGDDAGTLTRYEVLVCACDAAGGACEFGAMACSNGVDDDSDGLIDCAETSCATDPHCIPETACSNGVDDDLDGLRDCADPTCGGDAYCSETSCDNGSDDDGDGVIDCLEASCDGVGACEFGAEHVCNDGVDNDRNGVMDLAEPACAWLPSVLPACPDGRLLGYLAPALPQTIPLTSAELDSMPMVRRNGRIGTMALRFGATHTWDGDLTLTLFSPAGTAVTVLAGNGGSGDNYTGTVLVDSAAAVIGSDGNNTAPFTGVYKPEQPFSGLSGQSITGTWRHRLQDSSGGDGGSWTEASLGICLAP